MVARQNIRGTFLGKEWDYQHSPFLHVFEDVQSLNEVTRGTATRGSFANTVDVRCACAGVDLDDGLPGVGSV